MHMRSCRKIVALAWTIAVFCHLIAPISAEDGIPKQSQKFFAKYCIRCHGDKVQKADFRLDDLGAIDAGTAQQWTKVLEKLTLSEMPPPDELQPSLADTDSVTTWITKELERVNRRIPKAGNRSSRGHSSIQPLPADLGS
jgi:mono/diheme cytochrome c family protein